MNKIWCLIKGGSAYYKQAPTVMAESVNGVYDYHQALNDNGKVTIIMGVHDFIDLISKVGLIPRRSVSNEK